MTTSQEANTARSGFVETEPVGADVTGDGGDPAGDLVVEPVAELGAQMVERRRCG